MIRNPSPFSNSHPLFFVLLQCPTEFDEADRVATVWIKTVQAYAGASHECAGGTKDTVYANDDGGIMITGGLCNDSGSDYYK